MKLQIKKLSIFRLNYRFHNSFLTTLIILTTPILWLLHSTEAHILTYLLWRLSTNHADILASTSEFLINFYSHKTLVCRINIPKGSSYKSCLLKNGLNTGGEFSMRRQCLTEKPTVKLTLI